MIEGISDYRGLQFLVFKYLFRNFNRILDNFVRK